MELIFHYYKNTIVMLDAGYSDYNFISCYISSGNPY